MMKNQEKDLQDHKADFARNHRFLFKLGNKTLLYIQSLDIKREPTFFSKGIIVVNAYIAFKQDIICLLTSKSRSAQIVLHDGTGKPKVVFKLFGMKLLDKGYSDLIMDYTQTEITMLPVTFSFRRIEIEDVNL